ncbi:MAG TPA: discoidin domain-containing protein [Candidatus Binatia bacterium]|nr:discoidin domain-containing protein [Candidatus Binatia bacterium]
MSRLALVAVGALAVARAALASPDPVVLDDFEQLTGWTATASEGTHVWIASEPGRTGNGMRIGFDLNSGPGYVIVRKTFAVALPENWAFTFQLRGEGRPNNLEFKLIDGRGRNVWWRNQHDFVFPHDWQRMTIRKSRIGFAWGPQPTAELKQVGAIEIAIAAGEGGSGSVWIDDLAFEERAPAGHNGVPPEVFASTAAADQGPERVLDGDANTVWRSEPLPREQFITVDFHKNHECGGLVIDWDAQDFATIFSVQTSTDGNEWATPYRTATGHGGRDYIYMPDTEARFIRLNLERSSRGRGYGIAALTVEPVEFSASPNEFFQAIARDGPTGHYPKYFYGRQTYFTVIGVDGDDREALLNEEGMLEVDKGAFSIEPFLHTDGGLVTWDGVATTQTLEDGYLPIPTVGWRRDTLGLAATAFAAGEPGKSVLYARYRVQNHGDHGEPVQLFLAIRPFQVNPPWQTLNTTGGVTHIQELALEGRTLWVNRDRPVVSLTTPDRFGAATFEEGSVTEVLAAGRVPPQTRVSDPLGFASGAFQYNFYLEPRAHAEVVLAIPLHEGQPAPTPGPGDGAAMVNERLDEVRRRWQTLLGRVQITLPPEAQAIAQTMQTTLAYILINRDGAAIRPGSRNYARSWIRDGAITSTALLEMGFPDEVREFLRWYARYQGPDGKIPCCIDRRGADPVPEHDGPGAFIYAIAEYYRYTRDIGFVNDMWPHVTRAIDYLSALRRRRMSDEYRAPDKQAFFGLLPESISHEGYSAHPVHSYWDDFFALRGFKDAAMLARVLGDDERAEKYAALRDGFSEALYASIARTVASHGIDYIPGSVELGDFDPTSTSIALVPGGERTKLPEPALARTYERYYDDFKSRLDGQGTWEGFSPYEMRNVGALVRLGQKDRALEMLDWFLGTRRPLGWNEWSEITWRDATAPRFIGDMPHTWVGAGFVDSVRSLLAYERESDAALVLMAGVPAAWVTSPTGIGVKRLPTHHGILSYTARSDGPDTVRVRLGGDVAVPAGKIVVRSPLAKPLTGVTVDGKPIETFTAEEATIATCPADVVLKY